MSSKVKKHIPRNRFGELIQFIRVTKAMQTFEGVSVHHWQEQVPGDASLASGGIPGSAGHDLIRGKQA